MVYVYILKSIGVDRFYVGLSSDLSRRLKEHNSKQVKSTKPYAPYNLIYTKSFDTLSEARDYEKYLKVHSNREKILKDLKYIK